MPEDTGSFLGIFSWEWHVFAFEIDFQSVPGSILCYQYEYVQWPLAFIWNISGYCIRLLISRYPQTLFYYFTKRITYDSGYSYSKRPLLQCTQPPSSTQKYNARVCFCIIVSVFGGDCYLVCYPVIPYSITW